MLGAMFLFSGVDTISKFLTDGLHPVQIIWCRQMGLLVGVVYLLIKTGPSLLKTKRPVLQISRGVLASMSGTLFVFAVSYVALADAVAVSFVAPFMLTILGAVVLGEKVGIRRWAAVFVGFLGALIIIRPGMGAIHPAVMLVVIAAFCYSARQVIGRLLSDTDDTKTTIAYTAIVSCTIMTFPLPFFWEWPTSIFQVALLVSMAIGAAVGEVAVVKALEVAEAVAIAPIHYSLIVWGTIYGYLVFNQLPDEWTLLGTAIIVAAGIYTIFRDQKKSVAAGK